MDPWKSTHTTERLRQSLIFELRAGDQCVIQDKFKGQFTLNFYSLIENTSF